MKTICLLSLLITSVAAALYLKDYHGRKKFLFGKTYKVVISTFLMASMLTFITLITLLNGYR